MRFTRFLPIAAVAMALASLGPAMSQDERVECDLFKDRLLGAGTILEFESIPSVKIEAAVMSDHDAWSISYPGESGENYEGGLNCKAGKFDNFWIDVHSHWRSRVMSPSFKLIAAGLHAYTAWPPRQVIAAAYRILNEQPTELSGAPAEVELSGGALARISFGRFEIVLPAPPR
jgi:hypothetical protein